MPVEFALRPRIRLREPAPPRRPRLRVPRFALPVAAYWLAVGGLTYAFVHRHDSGAPPPVIDETALAPEAARPEPRAWWRSVPEPVPAAPPATALAPTAPTQEPAPEPAPVAAVTSAPATTAEPTSPTAEKRDSEPASDRLVSPALREPPSFSDHADEPPAPLPAPPRIEARSGGSLPSCEAAIASANQDVDFSQGNGTADLPTTTIAAVLENGAWLSSCEVPASTALEVCVAIRGGNVVGASVGSRPANASVNACVRRRASALQFPYSSHLDIARTRF
jgi:hypothetical protein